MQKLAEKSTILENNAICLFLNHSIAMEFTQFEL